MSLIDLNNLLTKEYFDDFNLAHIPSKTFYKDLEVGEESKDKLNPILVRIMLIRRKKMINLAVNRDLDQDLENRLSEEEVEFYKQIRGAIKKLTLDLIDRPLHYLLPSEDNHKVLPYPQ